MTKKECDTIRERCEIAMRTGIRFKESLKNIPTLLDALEAETARANKAETRFTQAVLDCAHAVKRVEALERAVTTSKSCRTCKANIKDAGFDRLIVEPCASCNKIIKQHWQFDYERFAGGEKDTNENNL